MRIGVIGTSNSILRGGYVDQLSAALGPGRIGNHSVGGSTIQLLSYASTKHDLSQYNVILIDVMVNEYNHRNRGVFDLGVSLRIFNGFLAEAKAAGSIPMLIVFPQRQQFEANEMVFNQPYIQMAQAHGCPIINIYHLLLEANPTCASDNGLWLDDHHIATPYHADVAQRIAAFIKALSAQGWFPPDGDALAARQPFSTPAEFMQPGGGFESIERGSQLMTQRYFKLPVNTPISFQTEGSSVYGIAYNAMKFCGTAEVTANGQRVTFGIDDPDAETKSKPAKRDFVHRVMGFTPVIAPSKQRLSGQMTFTPADYSAAEFAEVEGIFGGRLSREDSEDAQAA